LSVSELPVIQEQGIISQGGRRNRADRLGPFGKNRQISEIDCECWHGQKYTDRHDITHSAGK
jgi:hypothetical protein